MKVDRDKMIAVFASLGDRLASFGQNELSSKVIAEAVEKNGWFTRDGIMNAVAAIRTTMLDKEALYKWTAAYPIASEQKDVGVIMAGNIPLVGFFDLLCVLISSHRLYYKPSSKDHTLMTYIVRELKSIDPQIPIFGLSDQTINGVIATGSDNTNRYFRSRYGHIPAVFRSNRSSVAILDGSETEEDLLKLSADIFTYSGLGCRSVSHMIMPYGYEHEALMRALDSWDGVNPKYINNFRQRAAMLAVQDIDHRKGSFYLLREDTEFPAYISEITWHRSSGQAEIDNWLADNDNRLQCVVGRTSHPRGVDFGMSQSPTLTDYPDAVDIMDFLARL